MMGIIDVEVEFKCMCADCGDDLECADVDRYKGMNRIHVKACERCLGGEKAGGE